MSEFPEVDLTVLPQTYEQIIPESYLDEMGHVNVAWYSHLFSEGIKGLFGKMGSGVSIVKERAIGGFALESHIRYFKEVHLGDRILIYCRFIARNEKRFQVMEFMWNESRGEISACFEVVAAMIDMRARRPSLIPEDVAPKMDEYISGHQELDWEPPVCGVMSPR